MRTIKKPEHEEEGQAHEDVEVLHELHLNRYQDSRREHDRSDGKSENENNIVVIERRFGQPQ